ncbi:ATP-binding protein [Aliifodinibius sp. S!AR15-10]|uniref:histidine kinase dimerization/phosphoacceptor domain -containing protein n=1 Tax=Aliifodinibius sp. S!AR15-10 TaxID=2950437 RepID=UPI00285678CB|nr:histidine kinase dimerization/phosphoacceptor domain -containing protein [Aliifodinibius sp. S!AR15-10]MDR8389617.1 ATP-binding protein [Aliifodinibius sp. S!AR15-10]
MAGRSPLFAQSSANSDFTTFYEIRADADGDGQIDLLGDTVKVTGRANIGTGLLHEVYLQCFIQNDSSGFSIFSNSVETPFAPGDSIVARGVVQQYFGLTEINVLEYEVYEGSEPLPRVPIKKALADMPRYEGMLVGGEGTITGKGTRYNGKYITITPSDSLAQSIFVYVSNFHHNYQEFDFETLSVGDRVDITGVLSVYSPDNLKEGVYKIFLRTPADLKTLGITQYALILAGVIGIIITLLGIGWIISLKMRVKTKTKEISKALEEKNILLKEIHHRIKNNLAIISGLIELQMDSSLNEEAQKVLRDSQSRIQSMALVHDKLYQTTQVTDIGMKTYIEELVESLKSTFAGSDSDITLRFDIDDVHFDIDQAIPCGLLINELVVNSFKHAFNNHGGMLEIRLKKREKDYHLVVADNGKGLPENYREKMQNSLGLMLVDTFRSQLDAEMDVKNKEGAHFAFNIPADFN